MKVSTRLAALALGAVALSAIGAASPAAPPIGQRLDDAISAEASRGFSGVVLVTRRGTTVLDKAYGKAGGESLTTTSRFWIASTGKQFTSAAMMQLSEQRRLQLTDTIERFFPHAPPEKRGITLAQLLSHTSGFGQSYVSEGAPNREAAVAAMLAEPLAGKPGAAFHYSNTNYQLAVAIVEVVTGTDYHTYVAKNLWAKAGLEHTGFAGTPAAARVVPSSSELPPRLKESTWGGEGVFSTTHDLMRWYETLRAGPIVSRRGAERLFTPVVKIQEGSAALGWFVRQTPGGHRCIFTRGNEDFGANSIVYAFPEEDVAIVILTHAGDSPEETSWSRRIEGIVEREMDL